MAKYPKIEDLLKEERTPFVSTLFKIIILQQEEIQMLKDEKPNPPIKPSNLDKGT